MSNNAESGQISESESSRNENANTCGSIDNPETRKSKEKKEMFSRETGIDLTETKNIVVAECRNRKDQCKSPRNNSPRDTTEDLTFSAHNKRNATKNSFPNDSLQITSNNLDRQINRHPLQPINNFYNEKTRVYSNITTVKGITYPPNLYGNVKQFNEDKIKSPSLEINCSKKENLSLSHKSFPPGTSNSLPEENLECDSLGCGPDQSNASFTVTSHLTTFSNYWTFKETKPKPEDRNLSEELLKSLHDGKCELATDGPSPSNNMAEYLSQKVIPALQQQEEESRRTVDKLSSLQNENKLLKEKIQRLEQQFSYMQQQRMKHSQSQTHAEADWEYLNQTPEHFSIQVSEERDQEETNIKPFNPSHEMQQLREINKRLSDANHHWAVQWESLQRRQESEIEQLKEIIRELKEQEAKRQEDIDKILLSAKRRQNDAEDAKEEALGQLAQMTGQYEELKAQYEELKSHLVQRTQEKSDLETEVANFKAEQMRLSQTKSKKESKSSDKKLIKQLETELQVLQQQLKVFEEDFDVERQDRAKAQSEKDKLKEELEKLKTENIKLTEKLRESQQFQQPQFMNGHQHHQPTAQPQTDPYAQPFTPTMMLPRYNNQRTPYDVNAAGQQQHSSWNCEYCTYVNHPQRVICEICGTRKGQGPVTNTHLGSQMNSGQHRQQQQYIPGDLCIDSGYWQN